MKAIDHTRKQLDWLCSTAYGEAKLDIAVGDADKRPDAFFMRKDHNNLTRANIEKNSSFYRACNTSGMKKIAERPLNIYIKSSSYNQSWLMLDDLTLDQCHCVAGNRTSMIIQTSAGRHHLWLATSRPINSAERKHCQKVLVNEFGFGDTRSTDGEHLGRLAGYKSIKRNCWVNFISSKITGNSIKVDVLLKIEIEDDQPSRPMGFCALKSQPQASNQNISHHAGYNNSDAEFGWACGWLKKGLDVEEGIARLTKRATDRHKHNPGEYARITFENAAKTL
jgi:hypothetical protein